MGTLTRAHTFTSGELLTSANLNGELNGIVSVINGSIDAANVDTTSLPTLVATQTLTNKTLTSPKVGTNILDTNGNELVVLTATGSAVNEVTLANAATGNSPTLTASGGDANVNLTLAGKGTGKVVVTGDLQISGDDLFMATNTAGHLLIGDGTNYNPTALSGDVSVNSSGVAAIGSGVIVDADVNASAAIAQSKLSLAVTTSEIAASTLVIESEGIGSNDNDTTIPTSAAVKDYVDTNITAQDFDFTTSSGSGAVDLDSQALAFTPGEGIDITHTGQAVTVAAEDATTSNKGVASFATADFSVSSGAVSLQDLTTSHIAAATLVTESEGIGSNDNDTTLPTSAAVKDYVDTNVTAQDFDFTTTSGSGAVDLDSQALAFTPGEGVDITHSGQAVTIAGEDATDSNKGVASFASADFSVSSGAVSLVDITTSHLAAATLVTESEGIGSNDNDTTLPTSAAVKDYVDTQILTEDTIAELNDTTIGTLAAANLLVYDGSDSWDNKAISGDASLAASGALTLAATNTNLTTLANLTTVGTVGTGAWEATDVAVAHGGTGASNASTARTNLGLAIGTNVAAAGANSDITAITGLTTDLAVAHGGTGASTESAARTNLGVAIGSDVQAYDAGLASIAGLTTAANKMIYTTGSDTYAVADLTAFALTILNDADAAAVRTTIGAQAAGSYAALGANSDITSLTGLTTDLAVAHGGTGAGTFTANGILLGNGTSAIAASAAMTTNGTLLIGGTGGPEVATLTAGSNVTITNGDGTITIAASGGGGGASAFTDLSDVGSTTATAGRMMVADGDSWESVAVSGDIALASNGAMTIQANSVALATDTTGNYVATVADAGNSHITVANSGAENAAVTLNIADNAVGLAQMAGLARGKIIVGDSSGDPAALTAGSNGQVLTMDSSGDVGWEAAASGGHTIQEEGSGLTARANLNFVGAGVTATDNGSDTTIVTVTPTGASLPFTNSNGGSDAIALTSAALGENLVSDTTPQLGGNLDVNGQSIVSDSGNENIPITPHGTGSVVISKADINAGAIDNTAIGATTASTIVGTTIDASTDFTIGDTVITNGVITDTSGLSIAAAVDLGANTLTTTGSLQVQTIDYTDGDNAITIADGGACTFAQTPVFPDGSIAVADLDIDGATDIGAAIVDADLFIIDDGAGGTNRKVTASRLKTYAGSNNDAAQVFNESGNDVDFRIEGDSEENLLFVDASTDRVGIGTATPASHFEVILSPGNYMRLTDPSGSVNASEAVLGFYGSTGGATRLGYMGFGSTTHTNMTLSNDQSGSIGFGTAAVTRMLIDSNGDVGIGTDNPTDRLHIKGQTAGNTLQGWAMIEGTGTGNDHTGWLYKTDAKTFTFGVSHANSSSIGSNMMYWYENAAGKLMTLSTAGTLTVTGDVNKTGGTFTIDHPLEAKKDTHLLRHSFIEGPQADLIYRGTVTLSGGAATVNIDTEARMTDGTFAALNGNVQAFTSNETGWDAVRGSVSGNVLTIASANNASTDTISWMVIGERKDQHMLETDWTDSDGRVITETEKIATTPFDEDNGEE